MKQVFHTLMPDHTDLTFYLTGKEFYELGSHVIECQCESLLFTESADEEGLPGESSNIRTNSRTN